MSDKQYVACNVTYMKCDALGCDYRTEDVSNETLVTYLNKPCPKCGENLLTDKDFEEFEAHQTLAAILNKQIEKISPMTDEEFSKVELKKFAEGNTDGKGNSTFKMVGEK